VLRAALAGFAEYTYQWLHHADPEWAHYFEFLFPDPRALQVIVNRELAAELALRGDRAEIARPVAHWIHFERELERDAFAVAVRSRGFACELTRDVEADEDFSFALRIERPTTLLAATLDREVLELFDLAAAHGGDYDGWEAEVARDA
jgi:hypothetical protein